LTNSIIYEDWTKRTKTSCIDYVTDNVSLATAGLYVKIGQVLSARPDFVPSQYVKLFATVQDSIPQWPIEQVRQIMQDSFQSELGLDADDVLYDLDATALGSASIGQVHRAVLRDEWTTPNGHDANNPYVGGKEVAVKVIHPMAHDRFLHDFQVFRWLCRLALPGWTPILDELQRRLMTEFDYRHEAINLNDVRYNMIHSPYQKLVCVPQPHLQLCTKHVLIMELLQGKKLTESIEDELAVAFGDQTVAHEFLEQRRAGESKVVPFKTLVMQQSTGHRV
jgi:aarF domain-containing kinase